VIFNSDQMLQSMKYDCNPKDHLKFLDALHVNVAALPFTYGKLNEKAPIPLIGICYMGEHLAEIPPLSLLNWKWSMLRRIEQTEAMRNEKIDDGVKRMLLELKKKLGNDEFAWLAAQNAVKEVIFKLISPDLSEIAEIQPHDPFGASRLLWMLCNKFKAQVAIMGPQLNRELFTTIENFTEMCKDSSGVSSLFNKIRLLLKTGQAAKGCMSPESVIVNDIKSQMYKDDRLRQLSMSLGVKEIDLQELEMHIINHISRFPAEVASTSAKPQSVDSVPSQSFYATSVPPRSHQRMQHAFYGAQGNRFDRTDQNRQQRSFGRGRPYQQPFQNRLQARIPQDQWVTMSRAQQLKWLSLQRQIKQIGSEMHKIRRTPSSSSNLPKNEDRVEQVDYAAESDDPGAFGFGSNVFFAGEGEAIPVEDMTPPSEETTTSHLDSQVSFVVARLEDQQKFVFIPVDGGASSHVWKDPSMFISIKPCKTPINTAKEGEVIWSEGVGNVLLKTRDNSGELVSLLLKNVLYVPSATCSLISVIALRADGRQTIYPEPEKGGVCQAGIYNCRKGLMSPDQAIALVLMGNLSYIQIFPQHQLSRSERSENLWITWSKRLGHASISTLRAMAKTCDGMEDLKLAPIPRNYVSPESRMGKLVNLDVPKHVTTRATQPMEKIHMDLKGPMTTPSFNGHKYIIIFVDDHSHYSWLAFIKSKSEVFEQVKRFFADTALIRKKFPWCCLRCDNAGENTSDVMRAWLIEHGIRFETSTPHEPWQNGRVEVHIRHLANIARTIMISSGLKGAFWARAFSYANDVSNVQPRASMTMSPYEAVHGRKPNLAHFHPFGVECWIYVREDQRKDRALDPRGEPAIYLGRGNIDNFWCHVCHVFNKGAPSRETIVFTNNVVFGHTFPMNQHSLDLPLKSHEEDSESSGNLLHVNCIEASMIAHVVAQDATAFVVTLHSGRERLMSKSCFVDHLFQHDLNMPGFDISGEMRRVQTCFHALEDLSIIVPHANILREPSPVDVLKGSIDPKNYRDAMSRPDAVKWKEALAAEMDGLFERNVFSVVDPPDGQNILGTTVVYKTKKDPTSGNITYKARLCLRGDQQKEGVDYFKNKIYSAVLNCRETRILYALAPVNGWNLSSADIAQAFTYGELDVPLYCYPPPGYSCPPGKVLKLNNALYGCIQASACFKKRYTDFLKEEGFVPVNDAETIFKKQIAKSFVIIAIYVDDSLNGNNDPAMFRDFRKKFEKKFKIKTNDQVRLFLNVCVFHDVVKKMLTIHQRHYIEDCLQKFGLADCKGAHTPMADVRLSAKDQPDQIDSSMQSLYREMVGSLLYIASWTRPDIAYAVSELSRFLSNPGSVHLIAAKRVFRYLKQTISDGITYSLRMDEFPINTLWGFVDSDWAGCPDTRRSTSGFVFILNGAAISWKSKRQPIVALSTAEAEYISASSMVQEVIYLRKLLANLGFPQTGPTVIFADNETCIAWSEGSIGGSERAKHLDLRIHFLREAVEAGHIVLRKIDSKLNCSDLLTKPSISAERFAQFRHRLMGF